MIFVSFQFAGFALITLAIYHTLTPAVRMRFLLAASYVFFLFSGLAEVAILASITLATFLIGRRLADAGPYRRTWLWLGIAINLAALLLTRYLRGSGPAIVAGLSFYSLQAISLLVDSYTGALRTRPSFAAVAVYLAYFPKLLAGPIERPRSFFDRLSQPKPVDDATVSRASTLIVSGMTRKLVIADPLSRLLPHDAFSSEASLAPAASALVLVVFAFVLYNDFAGYTRIARGVSALFGIDLSRNFVRPFYAVSFADFWTRWHITLSFWIRDYVYLPLSRALLRRNPTLWNPANLVLPPMVAMLLSGVWHGTTYGMTVWGGLHGAYLVIERVVGLVGRKALASRGGSSWRRIPAMLLVFSASTAALAFFHMEGDVALRYFIKMTSAVGTEHVEPLVFLLMAPSLWLDWMESRHGDEATFAHWPRLGRAAVLAFALGLCFLMTRATSGAPFIYQAY